MMFKKNPGAKNKVHRLDVRFIFCIYLMKKKYHNPVCTWMLIFHVIERYSHPVKNTQIHICSVILMYFRQHLSMNVEMSVCI